MFLSKNQLEDLSFGLGRLGINVNDNILNSFDIYAQNLYRWNEKINLTRVPKEDVIKRHFLDSLSILECFSFKENERILDMGTGAGFPGVPLKIINPCLNIVLLDSSLKKIDFLNYIIKKLELKNILPVHATIEDYQKEAKEQFSVVTARALADIEKLVEYAMPFLTKNGHMIFFKSFKEIKSFVELKENDCNMLNYKTPTNGNFIIFNK